MSKSITEEQHRRIHELTAEGYKTNDIALLLEVGPTAVLKYRKIPCESTGLDPVAEHRLVIENRQLRREFNELLTKQAFNSRYEDFIILCAERAKLARVPEWAIQPPTGKKHIGIPSLLYCDGHLDENVDPKQTAGMNGYSRATALIRLRNMFENTIKVCRDHWTGLTYPGICMPWGGDIFSGFIHEELAQSNAGTMMESLLFWLEPHAAGIKMLVDEFGSVIIPGTVGNHGRNSKKPVHKNRVNDNFDWLFMSLLVKLFSMDSVYGPKITWILPESSDTSYDLYGTKYCLTHGDQFRGGSGIAGALSPMMIGYHRKSRRNQAAGMPFDYMVAGHWHQEMFFKNIIVGASLKGIDEYAFDGNFDYEPPSQALWITTPTHGVTFRASVHVKGEHEPWMVSEA